MEDSLAVIVFSPYYPPHIGGLENHAQQFTHHMAAQGHRVAVYAPQIPVSAPAYERVNDKVEIFRFPACEIVGGYPMPKFWIPSFWKQLISMHAGPYQIVCSRTRFFLTSLFAWAYARTTHRAYVHIEHGSDFVQTSRKMISMLATLYDVTCGAFVMNRADAVIANSKASADFVKLLTHGKVIPTIIYRGVEEDSITTSLATPLNHQAAAVITYIGRLMPGKGVADLLQAIAKIRDHSIACYIVGDGPQRTELEVLATNLNIQRIVHFVGEKSHEESIGIVKASDIVINPSYTEGLPTSVIEAALCKKAIIATNVGGTPEIISDRQSGMLFAPHDIPTLTTYMVELLDDQEKRINLGESAYQQVRGTFSWNTAIYAYETLFRNIHSQNR